MKQSLSILTVLAASFLGLEIAHAAGGLEISMSLPDDYEGGKISVLVPDMLSEPTLLNADKLQGGKVYFPPDACEAVLLMEQEDGRKAMDVYIWSDPTEPITYDVSAGRIISSNPTLESHRLPGKKSFYRLTDLPTTEGITIDWVPFCRNSWRIAIPLEQGMFPDEDGMTMSWKLSVKQEICPTIELGVAMVNSENWTSWTSGVGSYFHPFVYADGKVTVRQPQTTLIKRIKYAPGAVIYLENTDDQALWKGADTRKDTAPDRETVLGLLKLKVGDQAFDALNWVYHENAWKTRATCSTTEWIEQCFYDETVAENRQLMADNIDKCMRFVRTIRSQLESHLACAKNLGEQIQEAIATHPQWKDTLEQLLQNQEYYFNLYQEKLPIMQQPEVVEGYFKEILAIADDAEMDAETKEDKVKELGRKIRTIGGTQDDLSATTRMRVRNLRRRATLLGMRTDAPELREFLWKIRKEAGENIRARMPHEGR